MRPLTLKPFSFSALVATALFTTAALCCTPAMAQLGAPDSLFNLNTPLETRSISRENTTGEPGAGGKAASEIGPGRKGAPKHHISGGENYELCDIKGPGTIRHIWITGRFNGESGTAPLLRSLVVRAYWDGQEHPSIECPLGDLMGCAHAKSMPYQSAVHSVGERRAFNFWIPMPFTKGARITLTNDSKESFDVYYQIDYTINDQHSDDVGRLHVNFRRSNPTTMKEDFVLMPERKGKGRFLGAVMGVRTLHPGWWGEGEIKFFMDGDTEFPTLCGTGSEDYVGVSYGMQQTPYLYHGCSLLQPSKKKFEMVNLQKGKEGTKVEEPYQYVSMYRWHVPDPIYWKESCRVTIQQIGCCMYDRDDDWSTASFWYQAVPSAPLDPLPSHEERIADLEHLLEK